MRKALHFVFLAALIVWGASAVTTTKRKTPAKKTPLAHKASVSGKKKPATTARTTWRNRQLTPTPQRYKEIQSALVAKGYLRPEDATGTWGSSSVDALKKFQAEQKLDPSGKINSLSLIALGLGPKHDTPAETTRNF